MNADVEHIPAPLTHRPNVVMHLSEDSMTAQEQQNEDGWLQSDTVVEVTQ